MSTVNGKALLKLEVRMSRTGAWHADVEADDEADLSAGVEIISDGVTFSGTAMPGRSGTNGARAIARIVGGAGGLSRTLAAKSYESPAGVKVRTILDDILRETGETLSATAEAAVLDVTLARWHRIEGIASHLLVKLADHLGADWRVLADGTIWIGVEAWPTLELDHVLEDEDWTGGIITIAPDAPELTPGVTFLGQRIESVVHVVDNEGRLRTEAHIASTRSAFSRMMGRIRQDIDYSRLYRCRVVTQNADRTLQIDPDAEVMKGRGLNKVPVRLGLPGFRVNVSKGARCMFGFTNGDPSQPYACNFDEDGNENLVSVEFMKNGRSAPLMRVGDPVYVVLPFTPVLSSPTPLPVVAICQSGNAAYLG